MRLPIHRQGWPIIASFLLVTAALWAIWPPLGGAGTVISVWCVWFFRDPDRVPPDAAAVIVAPADGRVLPIAMTPPPEELGMGVAPRTRISIFMNIFNVHVNRIPADGTVVNTFYRPGRFFNASFDKASAHNERLSIHMRLDTGEDLAVVQIAGLIARRIRSTIDAGQTVRRGERFGIIRFGSRVDVYLPDGYDACVSAGRIVTAGETVIARREHANAPGDDASLPKDGDIAP